MSSPVLLNDAFEPTTLACIASGDSLSVAQVPFTEYFDLNSASALPEGVSRLFQGVQMVPSGHVPTNPSSVDYKSILALI